MATMHAKPKALIISGYGINCEAESQRAFELAGAEAEIVHVNDLIAGRRKLADYDILMFPGGFSYGDDTGSGYAFANKVRNNLWEELLAFIGAGKLILGVCNGFQIMTALGLFALPGAEYGEPATALLANTQGRYECRWVHLKRSAGSGEARCVFTEGVELTHIPIAHGEGRFHCDAATLEALRKNGQVVFTYCDAEGNDAAGRFPANPNGALADVAAICDRSGRIMGMMPHPERGLLTLNAPDYHLRKELARREGKELPEMSEANFRIFTNAVEYCKREKEGLREKDMGTGG